MEPLRLRKNGLFLGFLLAACIIYFAAVGLLSTEESSSSVIPRSGSRAVLEDLLKLKMKERKVKPKNKTSNVVGVRSVTPDLELSFGESLRDIDFEDYSPEDSAILKGRVETMVDRAKVVGEVCQAKKSLSQRLSTISLVWDRKHSPGIVWCPVYKVASTTWMRNFLRLAHFNEDNPKIPKHLSKEKQDKKRFSVKLGATHNKVFELYPGPTSAAEKKRVMQESVRVMIVRHPFSRLLSAYRDKMTQLYPLPQRFKFRELQKEIIAKYRDTNVTDESSFPSFPEFVQHVIDSTEKLKTPKQWNENVKCWLPYWVHCSVCSTDYNIIMKLETMHEDEQFLITLSRLEELKDSDHWVHLKGSSSSDLAKEYFKDVTRHQMQQLKQRFLPDFELFQYDIEEFLAVAKDA